MQILPMALAAGGSIIKGIGGLKAGQQNKKALYGQALEEERAGEAQAMRIRDTARRAMGQQIAGQFSNGFQGGSGSALDALTESQINATLDMMEVRRQAAGKARSMRAEGDMRLSQGKFALAEGLIGAASAVVGQKSDWAAAKAPS
jgi:hypothetical protein